MKKILQNLLCVILITVLFGCSATETNFDRVKAMNEYAGITNYTGMNLYAPTKHNIKEQVITRKTNDNVALITTIKTDENGRIIYVQDKELAQVLSEMSIDYDHLIFNQYLVFFSEIENATVILDSKSRIKKIYEEDGEDDKENNDIVFHYNGDKLISLESRDVFFDFQNRFSWNGNLINQANKTVKNKQGNTILIFKDDYSYDSANRLVKMHNTIRKLEYDSTGETVITIEEYNEYGDWIKANAIVNSIDQNEQTQEIITRVIKYW